MNRISGFDVYKHLDTIDRFKDFLLVERDGINVKLSVDDVYVLPTALEARVKLKLSHDPRDTVIGSYQTRNGVGTNQGTNYDARSGRFIFQPGGPTEQEVIVPLKGNNAAGRTIEFVIANTLHGATRITPEVVRIRFVDVLPASQDDWRLVYETDFISGFEATDSGFNASGQPCWSSRLAHGRTQPGNQELGLYADPVVIPGTNPFPIVNGKRCLRSEKITNKWPDPDTGTTYNYTAAVLRSITFRTVRTGDKVEARFSCPSGIARGAWPAFWLRPNDGTWPPEIDMLEWPVGVTASPWIMYTTQHWTDGAHRKRDYSVDIRNFGATTDLTQPHTWGIEVGERELYFTLDGVRFVTMENRSPQKTWYVLLNIAMGGSWPGAPTTATQFPVDMTLDWIRFYEPA